MGFLEQDVGTPFICDEMMRCAMVHECKVQGTRYKVTERKGKIFLWGL